ncbi:MAG: hypothetical protein ABIO70_16705 [Pseudomonadota bacterium]
MIRQILRIEGLGCLRRLAWAPGVGDAGPWVGVYAENGAGKSTLVAALRAAGAGEVASLQERRSLPAQAGPEVDLLTAAGRVMCRDAAWSGPLPSLAVFDRAFVDASVFDGGAVGPDQRAQLYRLALGSGEVEAARQVDAARRALGEAEKPRREIEKHLEARSAEVGFTLEDLRTLAPLRAPPPGHAAAEARLIALEARQDLRGLPAITPLPPVPTLHGEGLRQLLDRTAASLSSEALAAVKAHIAAHLDEGGEAWLRQGVGYAGGTEGCPFCGQPLAGSELAILLPRFFDDAYQRLQEQVARALERLAVWDSWVVSLRAVERANQRAWAAWAALLPIEALPDLAALLARAEAAVSLLGALVREKGARLLNPMGADPRVDDLLAVHADLTGPADRYGAWARSCAERCRRLTADVQAEIDRLQAAQREVRGRLLRGSPSFEADLSALDRATAASALRKAEAAFAEAILRQRERARTAAFLDLVNSALADFDAGFRMRDLAGKPSASRLTADFQFALVAASDRPDLARVKASAARRGEPRFDTLLSEGDRRCLALAVFTAHCLDTPDPARVVVLDDPFTSLDRFRRVWVQQHIARLAGASAQVWLLSHDARAIAEALPADATFLTLVRDTDGSTLERWDPVGEVAPS